MAYINMKCACRSFASPARKMFTIVRAGKTGGCFLVRSTAVWFDGIKIGSVERHFTMLKLVCIRNGMGERILQDEKSVKKVASDVA